MSEPRSPTRPSRGETPPGGVLTDLDRSEAADQLRLVTDSAPVSLAHCGADGRFLFVNRAYAALLDRAPADVIGKRIPEVFGTGAFESFRRHVEEAIAGRRVEFERPVPFPAGTRVMHCTYVPDPGPPPVGFVAVLQDVTDRWRADEALRESESFYRQTLESIPGMTFTNTTDGACDYVSEQWVEFTGVPAARQLGSGWVEVLHPDDRERVFAAWRAAVEGRGVFDVEYRVRDRSGRYEWFKVRSRPIRDASGAIVRWFGTAVNVDDLKRAEAALRASEQTIRHQIVELEAIYGAAPLGLCVFDCDLRFRRINERMAAMNGVPAAAHLGKTVREVLPNLAEKAEEFLRRVLATGQPVRFELRGETPADPGVERVWDEHWFPLLAADGTTEGVGVIAQEITEQVRADEALRDREQRLRLALDFAEMGSWDWALQTNEGVWSEKTRELFGVKAGAPVSYELFESRLHPDDLHLHHEETAAALQTGVYDNEFRIVLPDGEIRWMASRGRLLRDAQDRPVRMLGVVTDITERKQVEFAMQEADRRKDEFLATLAHELRNPLAPIRNGLQILRLSPAGSASAHRAQDMMERQLTHMVRLIDDLLDVSRVSRGKVELKKERVTLRSVVESALETSQPQIEAGRHELVVQLPELPLWLDADPTRVAQILGNLLNNAAKYTPPEGRITLAAVRDGDSVVIRVTDTGVGIPRAMLPKVFDLFTQVGGTLDRAQGGLGIGLSLAKKLVELHGGTIRADSPGLGEGSTFTVRLPLAPDPTAIRGEATTTADVQGDAARVLVVDDNRDGAESLALILELAGYHTAMAFDGPTALATARQYRPDVVFLDIGLPGMSGYEAAREFREDPELRGATLVALTGWGSDEDKRQAWEAGFDFHLTKPVETDQVMALLSEIRREKR